MAKMGAGTMAQLVMCLLYEHGVCLGWEPRQCSGLSVTPVLWREAETIGSWQAASSAETVTFWSWWKEKTNFPYTQRREIAKMV